MAAGGFFKEGTLTAGEGVGGSTQPPCGGRRPDAPAGAARFSINVRRIRKRLPVGKGLAPSGRKCPDTRRLWANSQVCSAFARAFLCRAVSCSERVSPFPTMRCCEFAGGVLKTGALLRGAPGSARPTTWMVRIRPTGCFGFVLLRGTPGTAFPTGGLRIRRRLAISLPQLRGPSGRRPLQNTALSPIPSPSGGGCRPQGRPERENVAGA